MKPTDECLAKVSPGRAASSSQAPRREGERRQRHQPPPSDSSPAAAAASRPSFSPRGSTADARSAAETAVRGAQFAPSSELSHHCACCAHRQRQSSAPVASIGGAGHCKTLTLPLAPSDRLQQEAAASLSTGTSDPAREPTTCWHRCSWPGAPTATTAR